MVEWSAGPFEFLTPLFSSPHDPTHATGIARALVEYVTLTVRGFDPLDPLRTGINYNEPDPKDVDDEDEGAAAAAASPPPPPPPRRYVARLHNDDVHTFDEVTNALMRSGLPRSAAHVLTTAVDRDGHAVVHAGPRSAEFPRLWGILGRDAGLLFSLLPETVVQREDGAVAAVNWLIALGSAHAGLARVVAQVFADDRKDGPAVVAFHPYFTHTFPENIRYLGGNSNHRLTSKMYPYPSPNCDQAFLDLATKPFVRCPRTPFAVLLMASPFLGPAVAKALNDVVIIYQQDAHFKTTFSQTMTVLYPALYLLYFRSVGTTKDTLFQTTVQVYTANSVVTMMSSDGVATRPLTEREEAWGGPPVISNFVPSPRQSPPFPTHITHLLASTLLHVLLDTSDVTDHSVRTRRYNHLCRDIEYCTENVDATLRVLSGERDPGMVEAWLGVCRLLQNMDAQRRRTDVHVEREDDRWQHAANLVLEVEAVSYAFLSAAVLANKSPTAAAAAPTTDVTLSLPRRRAACVATVLEKTLCALGKWAAATRDDGSDTGLYFDSTLAPPVSILGHAVHFPGVRRYTVSFSPVSVNLPLHRFASKLLDLGASSGLDLAAAVALLRAPAQRPHVAALADYPMRCLSFAAQVSAQMWRRNGSAAANLAYNYERPPLCRTLRNNDLVALQAACLALGPASILALAVDRFEVERFLECKHHDSPQVPPPSTPWNSDRLLEYRGQLLASLLRLVATLVTHLPRPLRALDRPDAAAAATAEDDADVLDALQREVAHLLLSADASLTVGQLQRAKMMVGCSDFVADRTMQTAIDAVCDRREDDGATALKLEPKLLAYELFDPEFVNHTSQTQQTALDRVREHRKKAPAGAGAALPVLSAAAVPPAHPAFAPVRRLLYQPFTCRVLETALRVCLDAAAKAQGADKAMSQGCLVMIVSRVVHVVTLQLHCHEAVAAVDAAEAGIGADESEDERTGRGAAARFFTSFFAPADEAAGLAAGPARGLLEALAQVRACHVSLLPSAFQLSTRPTLQPRRCGRTTSSGTTLTTTRACAGRCRAWPRARPPRRHRSRCTVSPLPPPPTGPAQTPSRVDAPKRSSAPSAPWASRRRTSPTPQRSPWTTTTTTTTTRTAAMRPPRRGPAPTTRAWCVWRTARPSASSAASAAGTPTARRGTWRWRSARTWPSTPCPAPTPTAPPCATSTASWRRAAARCGPRRRTPPRSWDGSPTGSTCW